MVGRQIHQDRRGSLPSSSTTTAQEAFVWFEVDQQIRYVRDSKTAAFLFRYQTLFHHQFIIKHHSARNL